MAPQTGLLLLLAFLRAGSASELRRGGHDHDHSGADSETMVVQVDAAMKVMVDRLLKRHEKKPPSSNEIVRASLGKVDVKAAARHIEAKLPADVASLVRLGVQGGAKQEFDEKSLAKARRYLNQMVEDAWHELDIKLIDCKEFEDQNRGTFEQTMTDIARIAEQIADLSRLKSEATEGISAREIEILAVQDTLNKETDIYMRNYLANKQEMNIRRNDMAVFQFMMQLVKCKKSGLLQMATRREARICETDQGFVLSFADKKTEAELERRMTPAARAAVNEVLARVDAEQAKDAAGLLQSATRKALHNDDSFDDDFGDDDDSEDDEPKAALSSLGVETRVRASTTTTTTSMIGQPPVLKSRVQKDVPVAEGHFKCPRGPPDCGLLHDKMSLMWGKFKDMVDELQHEMDKNEYEFSELKTNLNQQIDILKASKQKFIMQLAEATANLNADQMELQQKEAQRVELEGEYKTFMAQCRTRIEWIMYQDLCSYLKVRATLMTYSTVSPPEKIVDCGVSAWIPQECSVPCDDMCDPGNPNPYACGGWQKLIREVVVANNQFGLKCPHLVMKRKCGQYKCPVDCVMSMWSSFSKCTKECEGGVEGRTRGIITKPMNGGMACNTVSESRPCNTGSCDRDCSLKKWSQWSPCSVACGGGFQEQWRRVTRPIRGQGKCPKATSKYRYGERFCNTHECVGDEVCVAKQDLIMAIDGSGSLQDTGFEILKTFASNLIDRYKGEYYGYEDMKIGVIQFGNGEILADGSIANSKEIIGLSNDIGKVKKAVEDMKFLKGFTNMAQAFTMVEKLILLDGRRHAQSAVLTLTDGKPSFLFETYEKVMQLKDKHIKLFFAPVTEFMGEEMKLMKKWASSPWETNLVHIPGLLALKADNAVFAQKALVKFCPESFSPSAMMTEEKNAGYMLIKENGLCGVRGPQLSAEVEGAADCAALAEGSGFTAFSMGTKYARGRCFGETLQVTSNMIAEFNKNREKPPCAAGWEDNALFDFYVIETTSI